MKFSILNGKCISVRLSLDVQLTKTKKKEREGLRPPNYITVGIYLSK